jgi:selenocysteine lyase/cysteine desulfurase
VRAIGCDMLSATGRKFLRGPRATGFLYVRRNLLERLDPPFLDLHAAEWTAPAEFVIRPDARRFENWETNYAGKIGLGVAVDYALKWGLDAIWERVATLASLLRARLRELPRVRVHDIGAVQCGIVSFTLDGRDSESVCRQLRQQRMNVSVSGARSTLLDMESRRLPSVVRASVHYYNTAEEVNRFCAALAAIP